MTAPVRGLLESSLIEWEGRISCVLFLPMCNFRCPACHVPHLLAPVSQDDSIPLESIRKLIKAGNGWIDGVTITGGEPTVHGEALAQLCRTVKGWGVDVRVATNGSRPEVLEMLLKEGLLASVAMDVKHRLEPYEYSLVAGVAVDVSAPKESISLLNGSGLEVEYRTTVIPGVHEAEDIEAIAQALGPRADYVLQGFRPGNCLEPRMNAVNATLPETLEAMARRARPWVRRCRTRGAPARAVEEQR